MRFNETTHIISVGVLILTAIYTLVYSGISGVLLCAAVAFIAAAFLHDVELVVAVTILFVLLYNMVLKHYLRRFEGFEDGTARIRSMLKENQGAYESRSNSYMEGFEDVSNQQDSKAADIATSTTPAVNSTAVQEVTTAVTNQQNNPSTNDVGVQGKPAETTAIAKEEFESATNQLFKIGKMPSEHKEGPLLDAGSTLMKAMGSIDPDTTQKMTKDTRQLLETQKSLMGMMTQMRPILADGKELLQTFSGMFGGGGGNNSQFAPAK